MIVVIHLHSHATLPPQQERPVLFEYEFDWAPEPIEIIWNCEVIMFFAL
jgi:hypothetical protein